ncbi:MAG: hypothetical protein ABIK09_15395 [Pseudomonadota bacterium]
MYNEILARAGKTVLRIDRDLSKHRVEVLQRLEDVETPVFLSWVPAYRGPPPPPPEVSESRKHVEAPKSVRLGSAEAADAAEKWLREWVGKEVVVSLKSGENVVGTLSRFDNTKLTIKCDDDYRIIGMNEALELCPL